MREILGAHYRFFFMSNATAEHEERAKCCVLVPFSGTIDPYCEQSLFILEARGFRVKRVAGLSDISRGRSILASEALAEGFSEIMWIDSDIRFHPDDVDKLRRHALPLVGGTYVKKGGFGFACRFLKQKQHVKFGETGGLMEVKYVGTGFFLTRKEVYEAMRKKDKLRPFRHRKDAFAIPYFRHLEFGRGRNRICLGEDYSFCERASRSGYQVMVDTSIRLAHVGPYPYSWEDVQVQERFKSATIEVNQD